MVVNHRVFSIKRKKNIHNCHYLALWVCVVVNMAEETCETLDLSGQSIKKITKASEQEAKTLVTLILDDNDLQRLDCIDSFSRLENLSIAKNGLLRMHGVSRLTNLRELNLNNNAILTIEGLKDLVYLKKLQLSGNNIKSIEHLNNNVDLELLDLSDNQISHISDISCLKNLKHLHLERNRIGNLRQCERYIPSSLITLGLANNFFTDLNTLCHLGHLGNLEAFNIEGNPCVTNNGHEKIEFDYRPFVINWLMNVKKLDGFEVTAIESLKAEWLYSQGRGRQFREGEHAQLIQYLATTCPLGAAAPETEEQRKLRLILSKAQHHQQQLREQGPTPPRPKQSPRMHARITGRISKSPDRAMSSSFHSALSNKHHNLLNQQSGSMSASFSGEIPSNVTPTKTHVNRSLADSSYSSAMSQSFDSSSAGLIFNNETEKSSKDNKNSSKNENNKSDKNITNNSSQLDSNKALNQPLEAASKMVPVPDSMMSPDYQGPLFAPQMINSVNKRNINGTSYQPDSRHIPLGTPISCESPASVRSSKMPVHNKTSGVVHISKPVINQNAKNKGSPQLPRSAMSSPKMKHCTDQRKGSFSSRLPQNNDENTRVLKQQQNHDSNIASNRTKPNENINKRKVNGSNKIIHSSINQTEIQVTPPDTQEVNSSDDDSEMCLEKLQSIRDAANQRRKKQSISDSGSSENVATSTNKSIKGKSPHCAAITIQKLWRGYRTRNLNQKAGSIMHSIQTMRARQYIEKLSCDMEATKAALDSERKIQQLQMQAINALWKKISAMEADCRVKGDGKIDSCKNLLPLQENVEKSDSLEEKDMAVKELTQTCSMLQAQVQQLQGSMRDILQFVSSRSMPMQDQWAGGVSTQTEITAVHTPQGDSAVNWPYQKAVSRPCSLSLTVQNNNFKNTLACGGDKQKVSYNESKCSDASEIITSTEINLPGEVIDSYNDRCALDEEVSKVKSDNCVNSEAETTISQDVSTDSGDFVEKLNQDCLGVSTDNKAIINKDEGES